MGIFKSISDRYCCIEVDTVGNLNLSHHATLPRVSDGFVRYDRAIHGNPCYYHRMHVFDRKTRTSFIVLFTGLPEPPVSAEAATGLSDRLGSFA